MKYWWVFIISMVLLSCYQDSKKKVHVNKKSQIIAKTICIDDSFPIERDTFTLTEIADSVVYIRMDTKIREGAQIIYVDSLILVHDGLGLQVFKHTGKKLYEIPIQGSMDALPGCSHFYLYALKEKEVQKYDYQGNLINTINLKNVPDTYYGYNFLAISDSLFAFSHPNIGINEYELFFIDAKGYLIASKKNTEPFVPLKGARLYDSYWRHSLFRTESGCRYLRCFSDTLWNISTEGKIAPFMIETIIEKLPIKYRMEYNGIDDNEYIKGTLNSEPEKKNAVRYFETSRFLIGEYKVGGHQRDLSDYLCYDKQCGKLLRMINKLSFDNPRFHYGIFNDYDGGLAFAPSTQSGEWLIMIDASDQNGEKRKYPKKLYQEGTIIQNYETSELVQYLYRSDVWEDDTKRHRINDFYKNFDDSKHSVLMLVRLKK